MIVSYAEPEAKFALALANCGFVEELGGSVKATFDNQGELFKARKMSDQAQDQILPVTNDRK